MTRRPSTSRSEIEELINKGFSREEIATIKGITKQGVSWHLRNTGGTPPETTVEKAKKTLPWEITGDMVYAMPYRYVLFHLEYRQTGGKGMSPRRLKDLRAFYEKLTKFATVVRYDPAILPRPGQKYGGFDYVPRKESDGDLIVRVDKHTKIPASDRAKWSLPAREDWPE